MKNPFRELDSRALKRRSDFLKVPTDYNKVMNQRLKVLTVCVVVAFASITIKLYDITVLKHEEYKVKLDLYNTKRQVTTPPRGVMYDRNGKVIVQNVQSLNVMYNKPQNLKYSSNIRENEEWLLAEKFAKTFDVKGDNLTKGEMNDLYLLLSEKGGNELLSEEELSKAMKGEISSSDLRLLKHSKIKEKDLKKIKEEDKNTYAVYLSMTIASSGQSRLILENVTSEQAAYLMERKEEFKGFDVLADWRRDYPYGDTLRSVLGSVSTTKQGLPEELKEYYQSLGYPLNGRVGKNGLEYQYEDYLKGTPVIDNILYDEEGNRYTTNYKEGKNGYNLQLTIDIDLQQKVDKILTDTLLEIKDNPKRKFCKKLYVVLMNPVNGDVLAISSKALDEDGNVYSTDSSAYLDAAIPGSIVKPATLFIGLNEGVVKPGEVIFDGPLEFKGGTVKKSANNYGNLNDLTAIQKSSNVYMFHIAMRLAGYSYSPKAPIYLNPEAYDIMRRYYSMFGLGEPTGLDVPNEASGFRGNAKERLLLLDFAIGQYDSYTPMQMANYAATIANNGVRVKPRLVSKIYETNSDSSVVYEKDVEVVTTVKGNLELLKRSQLGMKQCADEGWCGVRVPGVSVASKTGTAENLAKNEDGIFEDSPNVANIGYAPFEKPEIAYACEAPNSTNEDLRQSNLCSQVMNEVLNAYFEGK